MKRHISKKIKKIQKYIEMTNISFSLFTDDDLVLVVKLCPVDHLEVHAGGGVVRTHHAVSKSHHEVEASDDDENEDDDDGHGACGQDRLRAERTDHTETSLTGDDGRYDLGHPGEAE